MHILLQVEVKNATQYDAPPAGLPPAQSNIPTPVLPTSRPTSIAEIMATSG